MWQDKMEEKNSNLAGILKNASCKKITLKKGTSFTCFSV